jgi:hypothetical protein
MIKKSYILLLSIFSLASAETTIWEEMPASQKGRYQYFKKNDGMGVFDAYEKMHGRKYIFACVNAVIFYLYAEEDNSVESSKAAMKNAEIKCGELDKLPGTDLKVPRGTPILLRYENDKYKPKNQKVIDVKIT